MSTYWAKCRNKKTKTEYAVLCVDDYFGNHAYGYDISESDETVLTEEQFNKDYEIINEQVQFFNGAMPNNAAKSEPMRAVDAANKMRIPVKPEWIKDDCKDIVEACVPMALNWNVTVIEEYADTRTAQLQQQCDMLAEALTASRPLIQAGPFILAQIDAALASYKAKKE